MKKNVLCGLLVAVLTFGTSGLALAVPALDKVDVHLVASPDCLDTGTLVVYASPDAGATALANGLDGFTVAISWDRSRLRLESFSKDARYTEALLDVSNDQGLEVSAGILEGLVSPDQPFVRFVFTKTAPDCVAVDLTANTAVTNGGVSVTGRLFSFRVCPCVTPTPVPTVAPTAVPTVVPTAVPTQVPPQPTATPVPPQPTATPVPTGVPTPTTAPEPTVVPTSIPVPTSVPVEPTPVVQEGTPTGVPSPLSPDELPKTGGETQDNVFISPDVVRQILGDQVAADDYQLAEVKNGEEKTFTTTTGYVTLTVTSTSTTEGNTVYRWTMLIWNNTTQLWETVTGEIVTGGTARPAFEASDTTITSRIADGGPYDLDGVKNGTVQSRTVMALLAAPKTTAPSPTVAPTVRPTVAPTTSPWTSNSGGGCSTGMLPGALLLLLPLIFFKR